MPERTSRAHFREPRPKAGWPRRLLAAAVLCLLAGLGTRGAAQAQVLPVGDALEEYARLLQLHGTLEGSSFTLRPLPLRQLYGGLDPAARHPWARVVARYAGPQAALHRVGMTDAGVETFWNSARPSGANDGAVWQGRGATAALTTGAFVRLGPFSAAFRPRLIFTENRPFDLSRLPPRIPRSPYAHPYILGVDIDLPQRFGPDPYTMLEPGQSYARLDAFGLAVGVSTENMWWGPGTWNAIVMSNNAPGFPHAFVGTSRPVDVWVGRLQGRWIWGELRESAYFDDDPENDRRFMTGIALDLQPRWVPGLSVGGTQAFMRSPAIEPLTLRDAFGVINIPFYDPTNAPNSPGDDKVISLYARWVLPESGFEVYGEWARGDHTSDLRDVFIEPEHGRGYTVGFQKAFRLAPHRRLRLAMEHTRLEAPREAGWRAQRSYFYVHEGIKQGYTERGQVIGAGIGPGANAQSAKLDLFAPWGRAGLFGWRTTYNNDWYHTFIQYPIFFLHPVELGGGAQALVFLGGFELEASVAYGHLLNQDFIFKNDQANVNLRVALRRVLTGLR